MNKILISELFTTNEKLLPRWLHETNMCIYLITNLVNDNKYVGQAKNLIHRFLAESRWGHYGAYMSYCESNQNNIHLYNAFRKYGCENFELTILEHELQDEEQLDEREIYWISYYNTFEGPGYNLVPGGSKNLHEFLRKLYPESNGVLPNYWISGRKALLEKYPETNGTPPQFIYCGGWAKGREASIAKYPETNGVSRKTLEAGHRARAEKYGMNGMIPQCLDAIKDIRFDKAHEALIEMKNKLIADGHTRFTNKLYVKYKVGGSPAYTSEN